MADFFDKPDNEPREIDFHYRAEEVVQILQDLIDVGPGKQAKRLVKDLKNLPGISVKVTNEGLFEMDGMAVGEGVKAAGRQIERLQKFDIRQMTHDEFEGVIKAAINAALIAQQKLDDCPF